MENWIEKIKEFIRKAMNKGLRIDFEYFNESHYYIEIDYRITICIYDDKLILRTSKGLLEREIDFTKRDLLEINAMMLSVEEYNEDMAMMEFSNFFGDEDNKPTTIDNLDDDD